eukprot:2385300-Pyramimonas_sp.AAC.1
MAEDPGGGGGKLSRGHALDTPSRSGSTALRAVVCGRAAYIEPCRHESCPSSRSSCVPLAIHRFHTRSTLRRSRGSGTRRGWVVAKHFTLRYGCEVLKLGADPSHSEVRCHVRDN